MMEVQCCIRCKKKPEDLQEYVEAAGDCGISPTEYVRKEEGTFEPRTGYFWCTDCYIQIGMPLGKARMI